MYISTRTGSYAARLFDHAHLVSILVLGSPRPLTPSQPSVDGSRVLVTLRLSSSTSMRMITSVHRETSNSRLSTHPTGPSGLSDLFLLVLLAVEGVEIDRQPTSRLPDICFDQALTC